MDQTSLATSIVEQLPVVAIFVISFFILLKRFMDFIEKRDEQWRLFTNKLAQENFSDMSKQMISMTQEVSKLSENIQKIADQRRLSDEMVKAVYEYVILHPSNRTKHSDNPLFD